MVAIYDLDQERARHVAAECASATAFSDPLQLIQDAGVDAVVIASPDPTHAQTLHECLRHHKPVLCEKPLATKADDTAMVMLRFKNGAQGMVHASAIAYEKTYGDKGYGFDQVHEWDFHGSDGTLR